MILFYYNWKSMKTLQYILKDYDNLINGHWGLHRNPQCFSLCEDRSFKVISEIGASCCCIIIIWRILLCINLLFPDRYDDIIDRLPIVRIITWCFDGMII